MTNSNTDLQQMIGKNAVGSDGSKIGKVGQIYFNDETGQPDWVTVQTGMFGSKESFAPLYGSQVDADGDTLTLAVSKDLVKDAPNVDTDEHMEQSEADELYRHYAGHLAPTDGRTETRTDRVDEPGVQGHDTSGPTTDDAMTRSEERLHVGTETVDSGQARLRKYIVEENVSQTVPVRHEEVRVEREPITDANRGDALDGAELSEEEHEVTLHAERPVTSKETVPVERVKLATETVTTDAQVDETVRKEQIDETGVEGRPTER